jgi:hypothetical protein
VLPISGSAGLCESNTNGIAATRIATKITIPTDPPNIGGGDSGGTSGDSNGNGNSGDSPNSNSKTGSSGGSKSSISAGAIAGIVIAGIIILLAGAALLLWIHRRSLRKGQSPKLQEISAPPQGIVPVAQYQPAQYQPTHHQPIQHQPTPAPPEYTLAPAHPEADGTQRVEMATGNT